MMNKGRNSKQKKKKTTNNQLAYKMSSLAMEINKIKRLRFLLIGLWN